MTKFIPFYIIVSIIILAFDYYFLKNWTRYVKKQSWNELLYRIPWGLAIVMFLMAAAAFVLRLNWQYIRGFETFWNVVLGIWYVPKFIVVPIMIVVNSVKFSRFRFQKKDERYKKAEPVNSTNIDSRRKFMTEMSWGLSAVPFIITANGIFRTRYDYTVHEVDVPIRNLPADFDGMRIAQVSDLHLGSFSSIDPIKDTREIVNGLKPDLVFFTGDFVNFIPEELEGFDKYLKNFESKYGVFGCLGNHDHYMDSKDHNELIARLNHYGIKMLINENDAIEVNNSKLQIASVDNASWKSSYADFDKAMDGLSDSHPTLMLCHDPTNWDRTVRRNLPVDLMLSGHTHGGQVGVELFGRFLSPVQMVYKHWAGLYRDRGQYLYVNRGIGTVGPPVRLFMPPEVTMMTLRNGNKMS